MTSCSKVTEKLLQIYNYMYDHFGDRKWWPADSQEEVVIGAILVQNVSWKNVEKAVALLKENSLCNFEALGHAHLDQIEDSIRSTRFYKTKAKKLVAFAKQLQEHHNGSLQCMFQQSSSSLRQELLGIYGIGPETADDIVLYAAELPTFVIDAYTKRILGRMSLADENSTYNELRSWFLEHLPADVPLLNQYHALLDAVGHHYCLPKKPHCTHCPLLEACPHGKESTLRERANV